MFFGYEASLAVTPFDSTYGPGKMRSFDFFVQLPIINTIFFLFGGGTGF
jgi:hypothetical protein